MHMQSNNDEKKYRFFDPFTGEAPLKCFLLRKIALFFSTNAENSCGDREREKIKKRNYGVSKRG